MVALHASLFFPSLTQASDETALQDAFHVILAQSNSGSEDDHSHITSLDGLSTVARSVDRAIESLKTISTSVNFTELRYRRFDGLGNNLRNPFWGASLHTERRVLPNAYDDDSAIPRYKSRSGHVLPSAREVSMSCFKPGDSDLDDGLTQMHMQFGQFLDHDIILTELEAGGNCCDDMQPDGTHPDMFNGKACFPIKVGSNDRFFSVSCLRARRSLGVVVDGVREQINAVTSYVDGSQVYGPAKLLSDELRTFQDGQLKTTQQVDHNGDLLHEDLPQLGVFKCIKDPPALERCPHAGDPRVNVFPGLTILHTTFHLEHNRIARKLQEQNPLWDDERLFQEARKLVIAELQRITYTEYLPKIIGPKMSQVFGFNDAYQYDENIDASVTNVFGADAFRFGHSQINGHLKVTSNRNPEISELYFRPEIMLEETGGVMKNIIIHQTKEACQKTDNLFSPEVLDKLFLGVDNPGESFDLPAFAVHRSRDHGLPPYVKYLDHVLKFLANQTNMEDAVPALNLPKCLMDGVYSSVEDVDLFVGAMNEAPVEGGAVGPTFAVLIGDMFKSLRNGDRFFYQTQDQNIGFTPAQLADIEQKASLANVFCKNNEKLNRIQLRVMETRSSSNRKENCNSFEDFDFSLWRED